MLGEKPAHRLLPVPTQGQVGRVAADPVGEAHDIGGKGVIVAERFHHALERLLMERQELELAGAETQAHDLDDLPIEPVGESARHAGIHRRYRQGGLIGHLADGRDIGRDLRDAAVHLGDAGVHLVHPAVELGHPRVHLGQTGLVLGVRVVQLGHLGLDRLELIRDPTLRGYAAAQTQGQGRECHREAVLSVRHVLSPCLAVYGLKGQLHRTRGSQERCRSRPEGAGRPFLPITDGA